MKTIQVNLYKFEELSKQAKKKALNDFNNTTEYFWEKESFESLKKFAEHFNCELSDWSIDYGNYGYSSVKFDIPESMEEISEQELKKLIESMGSYDPKTLTGLGDCKFTGYVSDESVADGARHAFYKGVRNLEEILQAGFKTWLMAIQTDFEYQQSEEAFSEHCQANDYTFEEDGTIHNAQFN